MGDFLYSNSEDWVESCTALAGRGELQGELAEFAPPYGPHCHGRSVGLGERPGLSAGKRHFRSSPCIILGFPGISGCECRAAVALLFGSALLPQNRRQGHGRHNLDRLRGDLIPDFRLIDYFITLLSNDTCPALNGIPGNREQLKSELMDGNI